MTVRAVTVVDGERVITRVPDPGPEDMVLADDRAGREASNPPGSFEALYQALSGSVAPVPEVVAGGEADGLFRSCVLGGHLLRRLLPTSEM